MDEADLLGDVEDTLLAGGAQISAEEEEALLNEDDDAGVGPTTSATRSPAAADKVPEDYLTSSATRSPAAAAGAAEEAAEPAEVTTPAADEDDAMNDKVDEAPREVPAADEDVLMSDKVDEVAATEEDYLMQDKDPEDYLASATSGASPAAAAAVDAAAKTPEEATEVAAADEDYLMLEETDCTETADESREICESHEAVDESGENGTPRSEDNANSETTESSNDCSSTNFASSSFAAELRNNAYLRTSIALGKDYHAKLQSRRKDKLDKQISRLAALAEGQNRAIMQMRRDSKQIHSNVQMLQAGYHTLAQECQQRGIVLSDVSRAVVAAAAAPAASPAITGNPSGSLGHQMRKRKSAMPPPAMQPPPRRNMSNVDMASPGRPAMAAQQQQPQMQQQQLGQPTRRSSSGGMMPSPAQQRTLPLQPQHGMVLRLQQPSDLSAPAPLPRNPSDQRMSVAGPSRTPLRTASAAAAAAAANSPATLPRISSQPHKMATRVRSEMQMQQQQQQVRITNVVTGEITTRAAGAAGAAAGAAAVSQQARQAAAAAAHQHQQLQQQQQQANRKRANGVPAALAHQPQQLPQPPRPQQQQYQPLHMQQQQLLLPPAPAQLQKLAAEYEDRRSFLDARLQQLMPGQNPVQQKQLESLQRQLMQAYRMEMDMARAGPRPPLQSVPPRQLDAILVAPPASGVRKIAVEHRSYNKTRPHQRPDPRLPFKAAYHPKDRNAPQVEFDTTHDDFAVAGKLSGRIKFRPPEDWLDQTTARICIFYFVGTENSGEWTRSEFGTVDIEEEDGGLSGYRETTLRFIISMGRSYIEVDKQNNSNPMVKQEIIGVVACACSESGLTIRGHEMLFDFVALDQQSKRRKVDSVYGSFTRFKNQQLQQLGVQRMQHHQPAQAAARGGRP